MSRVEAGIVRVVGRREVANGSPTADFPEPAMPVYKTRTAYTLVVSEYEELVAEKESLEAEFGQIVQGQEQALKDGRDDALHAGQKKKDEIRARLGKIKKRLDEIHGT